MKMRVFGKAKHVKRVHKSYRYSVPKRPSLGKVLSGSSLFPELYTQIALTTPKKRLSEESRALIPRTTYFGQTKSLLSVENGCYSNPLVLGISQ